MKKSTILFVLVVYVLAFFIVGLVGVSLRSHYQMNYVTEILVTPFDEQQNLDLISHTREEIINEEDKEHVKYKNTYEYETEYVEGLVLKFNVSVKPDESTYKEYECLFKESSRYTITKNIDSTVFIEIKKPGTKLILTLQSTDGNRLQTIMNLTVF